MIKIILWINVISRDGDNLYAEREIEMPFLPYIGMQIFGLTPTIELDDDPEFIVESLSFNAETRETVVSFNTDDDYRGLGRSDLPDDTEFCPPYGTRDWLVGELYRDWKVTEV